MAKEEETQVDETTEQSVSQDENQQQKEEEKDVVTTIDCVNYVDSSGNWCDSSV